jgi:sterol-4alpha-carboxylate 3-dehydrogenase (decarboxylating)
MVLEANGTGEASTLTTALRLCTPFGDNHEESTNAIVENARQGKLRFQTGDGKNLSDWTYIENGARAHVLAAQALLRAHDLSNPVDEDERVDGEAFFITNGEPVPFWQFLRALGAAAGYPTRDDEIRVLPPWFVLTMAFASEWGTW